MSHRLRFVTSIAAIALAGCSTAVSQESGSTVAPIATVTAPAATPAPAVSPAKRITYTTVPVNGRYIAMTFDDGPHGSLTPKLLDVLKARKIRATFYVIGQNAAEYKDILKRTAEEGHEIANHTWSHPNLAKMSKEQVRSQLEKTRDVIVEVTGKAPVTMRPPYGSLREEQRKWIFEEFGYPTILWAVDPLDWKRPGASVVTRRIVSGTGNGAIILAHDIHPGTIEAMPSTLDQLLASGYQFVTVSELIAMERPPAPSPSPAAAVTPKTSETPAKTESAPPAATSSSPSQPSAILPVPPNKRKPAGQSN